MALRINPDHAQVPDTHVTSAHSACHTHAFEHFLRSGCADGPGFALGMFLSVRAGPSVEPVAFHHPLKAASLDSAAHRHRVPCRKHRYVHAASALTLRKRLWRNAKLAHIAEISQMPEFSALGFCDTAARACAQSQRGIPVAFRSASTDN